MTVEQAVEMALANNPDLAVVRIEPELGAARSAQARSAFTPYLTGSAGRTNTLSPPTSFLVGNEGVESSDWFSSVGVRQRMPVGGGTWNISWDNSRTTSDSIFNNFNPTVSAGLMVAFSQPLLKDLTIDAARQQVIISKRNQSISDLSFKQAVVQTAAAVKRAYWDLVAANANVTVQQQSLDLAMELVRQNKAKVDVGQSPPLDLVAAEAEAAQRREQLIVARQTAREAEDALRALIMKPGSADFWTVKLQPTDKPPVGGPLPDVDAAVKAALEARSDLEIARRQEQNAATSVKYFKNQRLPDLRLEASHRTSGLGGTRFLREGGFPGTVVGQDSIGFGTVADQIFGRDYPAWTFGVTISYPLGRSYEDAGLARARLEQQQAKARIDSLEIQAVQEIRQAAWLVESTAQRIEATTAARQLAEQRLDAEQKRYEVGMSTSFLVVQAQRDLAQARTNELRAMLDHQVAQVNFDTLQQAPATGTPGGSVQLTAGGSIASLPPGTPRGIQRTSSGSSGLGF